MAGASGARPTITISILRRVTPIGRTRAISSRTTVSTHAAAHDDRYEQGAREHHDARTTMPRHDAQYDDRYRVARPPAGDYDGDHYYADDGHMPPQSEDGAAPSRRRGGLLTVAAVLGLAVIGTAGAFGYRAFTSGPGGSANPPVIKADTAPAKIVPPAATPADAQGKPFQERIGTATTERIVPREEQPVSLPVPPQPRPGAPQNAFAPTGAAPLVAPPPSTPPGAFNEPKRVRTQTIRPDYDERRDRDGATAGQFTARACRRSETGQRPDGDRAAVRARAAANQDGGADAGSRRGRGLCGAGQRTESEAEAQSSYRSLQQKYPSVLGGREASIRRVDLGDKGGIFYRAQVGSFATLEQANTFCNNLKEPAASASCSGTKGDQLSVTPALLTTLAHFTTSASRIFRNASGEVMSGSAP